MAADLPANFHDSAYAHGAPVVQVAQAAQPKCDLTSDRRYKIGNTGQTLVVKPDADPKQTTYTLETPGSDPVKLEVLVKVPTNSVSIVTFANKSVLTESSRPGIKSLYKDAQGKSHTLVREGAAPAASTPQCRLT